jgi:hypothetical protein
MIFVVVCRRYHHSCHYQIQCHFVIVSHSCDLCVNHPAATSLISPFRGCLKLSCASPSAAVAAVVVVVVSSVLTSTFIFNKLLTHSILLDVVSMSSSCRRRRLVRLDSTFLDSFVPDDSTCPSSSCSLAVVCGRFVRLNDVSYHCV